MSTALTMQLFCFPYAGGSAGMFRRWRGRVPSWLEIVPVELAGRGSRRAERLETTLQGVVSTTLPALQPDPARPFALFGHSFGALVAFECARQLEEKGHEPALLLASAAAAPSLRAQRELRAGWSEPALRGELARLRGTPAAVLESPELMELILPVLRADFQACAAYDPGGLIDVPVHVLGGADDDIERSALDAWRAHTRGDFDLTLLPGGHFFLHERERELLAILARSLAGRLPRSAGPLPSALGTE